MNRFSRILIAGALAAVCIGGPVFAGYKEGDWDVVIDPTGLFATGTLSATRNTTSPWTSIGCSQYYSSSPSATCTAQDAAGRVLTCYTTSESLLKGIRSIQGDSRIRFVVDSGGYCNAITVITSSTTSPKR